MEEIKIVNDEVKKLVFEKIMEANDKSYLLYLKAWQEVETKKNKRMIKLVLNNLESDA